MQRDIPDAQLTHLAPAKHMGLIEHHTFLRAKLSISPVRTKQLQK
jgi:hypothetical protein